MQEHAADLLDPTCVHILEHFGALIRVARTPRLSASLSNSVLFQLWRPPPGRRYWLAGSREVHVTARHHAELHLSASSSVEGIHKGLVFLVGNPTRDAQVLLNRGCNA